VGSAAGFPAVGDRRVEDRAVVALLAPCDGSVALEWTDIGALRAAAAFSHARAACR
jgi:hypothetical protein